MIGNILKYIRICNDLSSEEVANKLGIKVKQLNEIEKNKKPISIGLFIEITNIYNIEKDKIYSLVEEEQNGKDRKQLLKEILEYYIEKEAEKNSNKDIENLFLRLGYTKEQFKKIMSDYRIKNVDGNIIIKNVTEDFNWFIVKGLNEKQIIKITTDSPCIFAFEQSNLEEKYKNLISLGYTANDIKEMTLKHSYIYNISIKNLNNKIKEIEKLGFNKQEVLEIIKKFPTTANLGKENISEKIYCLLELGYDIETIKKLVLSFPQIFSVKIENILPKINFYEGIGIMDTIISHPKNLMQSVDLSYARYKFFEAQGIKITAANSKKLFVENKQFERQYKITKQSLLDNYSYKKEKGLVK